LRDGASPRLAAIRLAADPEPWDAAGFTLAQGAVRVGSVSRELAGTGAGRGVLEWLLDHAPDADLDGLPTSAAEPPRGPAPRHANGVTALDHLVAFSPDLDRTVGALERAGLDLRRVREGPTAAGARRQAFFRVGEPLLEVIEHPPGTEAAARLDAPARLWGLAFACEDLDAAAASLGELLGEPRDAIQPGRRIVTFRRAANLGAPVALMSG
jgi:hypothetical protein